eukprot:2159627-Amphidinium_carterae.3
MCVELLMTNPETRSTIRAWHAEMQQKEKADRRMCWFRLVEEQMEYEAACQSEGGFRFMGHAVCSKVLGVNLSDLLPPSSVFWPQHYFRCSLQSIATGGHVSHKERQSTSKWVSIPSRAPGGRPGLS